MPTGEHFYTAMDKVGMGLCAVLVLAGVACFVGALVAAVLMRSGDMDKTITVVGGIALGLVLVLIGVGAWFPFDQQYHGRTVIAGTVRSVDSRILGGKDTIEQKYVITFREEQQEYGCKDTRCATVRPGDRLELVCTKQWDVSSADGWDCGWRKNERADS